MKKFKRLLSAVAVGIACAFALTSCGKEKFWDEWKDAEGITVTDENCFELLTLDEVVQKKEANVNFVVFIGDSSQTKAVTAVNEIQAEVDNVYYEGVIYFLNAKELNEKPETRKDAIKKLGVKEIVDSNGLVAVCYKEGKIFFDTSNSENYDQADRFYINGGALSFVALADYVIEKYPVEKSKK